MKMSLKLEINNAPIPKSQAGYLDKVLIIQELIMHVHAPKTLFQGDSPRVCLIPITSDIWVGMLQLKFLAMPLSFLMSLCVTTAVCGPKT